MGCIVRIAGQPVRQCLAFSGWRAHRHHQLGHEHQWGTCFPSVLVFVCQVLSRLVQKSHKQKTAAHNEHHPSSKACLARFCAMQVCVSGTRLGLEPCMISTPCRVVSLGVLKLTATHCSGSCFPVAALCVSAWAFLRAKHAAGKAQASLGSCCRFNCKWSRVQTLPLFTGSRRISGSMRQPSFCNAKHYLHCTSYATRARDFYTFSLES